MVDRDVVLPQRFAWWSLSIALLVLATSAGAIERPGTGAEAPAVTPTTLGPAGAVGDEAYRVFPGDVIAIRVFGEPDLSSDALTVGENGSVTLALIGEVPVAGKSAREIEMELINRLKGSYLIDPKVSVAVKQYRSVYVNGQVRSAGAYPFEPGLTVRKVISKAGGLTERASTRRMYLISEGDPSKKPRRVSMDDPLKPGDILTVEESFF